MIAAAERSLGLGEPNSVQQWYRERNGAAYNYNFPWCNAAVTYWATQAGERDAVLFGTDYAYTVAHAARFKAAGQWHAGAGGIRRGDVVFFDWGGTNDIARIDHVGIVTGVSGANVYTIEGNTANVCARRVRREAEIAGYGRPKYRPASSSSGSTTGTYTVKSGDTLGEIAAAHHTTVQALVELNGIKDPNKIGAGRKLKLPASTAARVVSLAKIVAAFKADAPRKGTPVSYEPTRYVEQALVAEGLLAAQYADGHAGTATRSAYTLYQQRLGYRGADADGLPGTTSLKRLGDRHGFTVVA
ncbi:LysM peptidoglycan-binding domain-containing protein [Streptomyces violarus]|uniref:LysM peptidoglycan-binding domain-containing protein n=1 Tax=Streptomyces violarus TaxID=67380 RepID=UPI0021BE3F6A|nr:LysM peptidoglycan-binding domain-containing protein [Streptomyces violarus]MCT9144570.1 LysM peptidoglycan-binding domain-containing protein [Streptomyces violarus]